MSTTSLHKMNLFKHLSYSTIYDICHLETSYPYRFGIRHVVLKISISKLIVPYRYYTNSYGSESFRSIHDRQNKKLRHYNKRAFFLSSYCNAHLSVTSTYTHYCPFIVDLHQKSKSRRLNLYEKMKVKVIH